MSSLSIPLSPGTKNHERDPAVSSNEQLISARNTSSYSTRKTAEKQLGKLTENQKADYLESILNASSTIAVVATDLDFHITYFSPTAQSLFGYKKENVIGKRITEVQHLGVTNLEKFRTAADSIKTAGEFRFTVEKENDGKYRLIESVVSEICDKEKKLIGFLLNAQDITRLNAQQERIARTAAEEHALGTLLCLSLSRLEIAAFLQKSLETLLTEVPWLNLLPKGGIFLTGEEGEHETLQLIANYKLSPELETLCTQVPFGYCICGRAAAERKIQFIPDNYDSRHETSFPGMEPHGHYAVPILLNETVLGILILYLPPNHEEKESDKNFLKHIADVLSMGISKRKTETEIEYQAKHDNLTALPNRHQLIYHLDRALARARRHGHFGAVMFIDLDHFKNINDSLGHTVGDEVLRQVSGRLINVLRKEDAVARLGGDEFVVLLSEEGNNPRKVARQAQLVAEKIQDSLSETYTIQGYSLNITPSIGVALFPDNNETTSEVLQQADTAMYRAKAEGRNCIRFFLPAMQMVANERLKIEQDLRLALDEQKFQLHFQPQVNSNGLVVGAEALLRCPKPDGNSNRVDLCIAVAETTGLILPIGEWVLQEACLNLKKWTDSGIATSLQHLCVNISPKQFLQRDFVSLVQRVLNETGIDPHRLVLEITESTLIDTKMDAIETMQALKRLGIGVAIDDFGTGYSSLAYLTRLPLDILKIDRSFVSGVNSNHKNAAVVEALMAMARQLGLSIVAEGVETREELDFLLGKGCECFQGFYYSRPQPAEAFREYLVQQNS